MAFKMKRSGMNLRSTTRVAPQLTKYESSSPMRQSDVVQANYSPKIAGSPTKQAIVKANYDPKLGKSQAEQNYEDSCYENGVFLEGEVRNGILCEDNPDYTPSGKSTPGGVSQAESSFEQEEGGPQTNILTPREQRRNIRMLQGGSNKSARLVNRANRNIRRAVRKGQDPSPNDLAILSGELLPDYTGLNIGADSTGTVSLLTRNKTNAFQQNPGGTQNVDYTPQIQKEMDALQAKDPDYNTETGQYTGLTKEQSDAKVLEIKNKATQKIMDEASQRTTKKRPFKPGSGMSDRTKRLLRKRGYSAGDEIQGQSVGSLADSKARKLTKKAKKDGISKEQKERLNRRIERRGGSPVQKISVSVTRPSYKMKGFGK